jgi:hypothetical protein
VDQGRTAAVQGDSRVPAADVRREKVELEQLGILGLAAGSVAPVATPSGETARRRHTDQRWRSAWPAAQAQGEARGGRARAHGRLGRAVK